MSTLTLSCCRVDLDRRIVRRREGTLRLTSTEAALLRYLAERPGQAVPREELLQEVWGYAEGVASRSVDTAVRRLRAKLESDRHHPAHLISEHGVGYRLLVFGPDASAVSVPMPRSVEETVPPPQWRPQGLPGELGRLIGRGRALAVLRDHMSAGVRLVTITGAAGVGKTRLALRMAMEERDRADADATFVDLTSSRDAGGVVAAIAGALRYDLSTAPDPAGLLGKWLAAAPAALLVLDNLEQLDRDAIQLIGVLLRAAPRVRVLGTSRTSTGLPGEVVIPLEPLSPADGAQLIYERAKAAGCPAQLRGTPSERQELAVLLDSLPLAIELAAPRLRLFGVKGLRERLERGDGLVGSAGPVGSGVRRALDWTLALLTPEDQDALARLSCFAVRFSAVDAEGLLGPRGAKVLGALLTHSLLRPVDVGADGLPRFSMYRSVHELATRMLRDSGGAEEAERAHAALLLERLVPLARTWEKEGGESRLAALHDGRDDLLLAVSRARLWSPPDLAVPRRAALALYRTLRDGGAHAQALEIVSAGLGDGLGEPVDRCLLALFEAESLLAGAASPREAALARAEALAEALGDGWLSGRAALVRTWAEVMNGSPDSGRLERADRLMQEAGDHRGRALVLDVLAHTRRFAGDLEQSVALRRLAATLHEEQGSRRSLSLSLEHLAGTLGDLGRWEDGLQEIGRAIAISEASGNPHDAAIQRYQRSSLLFGAGRLDETERDLEAAMAVLDAVGDNRFAGRARHGIGCVRLAQGEPRAAEEAFRAGLRCFGDDDKNACATWVWLAVTRYRLRDIDGADEALRVGRRGFEEHWAEAVGAATLTLAEAHGAVARWMAARDRETAAVAREALARASAPDAGGDEFVAVGVRLLQSWAGELGLGR